MTASPHEIEIAVAEEVQLYTDWSLVSIDEDGEVVFQFLLRCILQPDPSARTQRSDRLRAA